LSQILSEHLIYLSDAARLDRFKEAIAKTVRPGDLVADVGCGFGVLGLWCLQAGAARVWGIDSTRAIEIARETLARAGLKDRYVFINERSFRVELPERVDVVICDHVGHFGLDYNIVHTLNDARKRFLKSGGKVVPSGIKLMLGVVESADCRKAAEAWGAKPVPVEYQWLREYGINTRHARGIKRAEFLGEPSILGSVDFKFESPDFFSFKTELLVARDGVVDGLAGWHECELAKGVRMTNSPFSSESIARAQAFLPIDQPLEVKAGELLSVSVMTRPADGVIAWSVEAPSSLGRGRFVHSTWKSLVLTKENILRIQPDRVPRPSRLGHARRIVMEYCDGKRTSKEIEQVVLQDHPHLFPTREEISRFVFSELGRETE
jgi:SAM-dependent methyltransferase